MNVFLDANVLVSVLNKEYPVFTYSSRILSIAGKSNYHLYTSPLCLAIAFYFSEKKSGEKLALQKIKLLAEHLKFTSADKDTVTETLANKQIHDFEDGLLYYSAVNSVCKVIVTENTNDFYYSEVEVINSRAFFEKYLIKI